MGGAFVRSVEMGKEAGWPRRACVSRKASCCKEELHTMKNQSLIVLVTVAATLVGLSRVEAGSVAAAVPGNTVVVDAADDLQLRNCDPSQKDTACSLPEGAPSALPGYFDINSAKITQIGGGQVDLSMTLQEPVPTSPPQGFVAYIWQFEGGCVDPQRGNKAGVQVVWHSPGGIPTWDAHWFEIVACSPRQIAQGDPVEFRFTEDGVKVRVALADLLTAMDPDEPLIWYAAVRRVPFVYDSYTRTAPVDFAPNVYLLTAGDIEDPATWVPQVSKSR